ncbi:MAG TPA: gliding motility-associated ABC transporter ATP-binding subunit GldA, partial [Bacteroidetes bacterium]|nr:gliding motility-associated ABC transporter ATP-binding subunit GldA [Bacteroidota bacterium]
KGVEQARFDMEDSLSWKFHITGKKGHDLREDLFKKIVSHNLIILGLHQEETSLEDIFRKLTQN